jgi:hypothetical protein
MSYAPSIPRGLEQTVLRILSVRQGKQQAMSRTWLVRELNRRTGNNYHERIVRECIKQLRRQGNLICSTPGEDGGYYMAASKSEFDLFDQTEFGAKIADMNETRQAMLKAARQKFGDGATQEKLLL